MGPSTNAAERQPSEATLYECPDCETMLDSRAGASALTTRSHALRFGSSR